MFRGREIDLQLAFYIFENAAILGKMIVEPSNYMTRKEIRNCTQMLESKLPQGVELVIGSLYVSDYKHGWFESEDTTVPSSEAFFRKCNQVNSLLFLLF